MDRPSTFLGLLVTGLAVCIVLAVVVGETLVARRAVDREGARAQAAAVLLAASLRREIDKAQLVPIVLAADAEVRDALVTRNAGRIRALNAKLETLSRETGAAAVYLVDSRGTTLAASNWRLPTSFVGLNYSFRGYFHDAIRDGRSRQFALGTRSRRPGLYLASRIVAGGRAVGVIVIKVEFDDLEAEWAASPDAAFATNDRGIILVTGEPAWRFEATGALSAGTRAEIRRNLEFGAASLAQNRLFARRLVGRVGTKNAYARPWIEAVETVPGGWRVHVLASTVAPVAGAVTTVRLVALTVFLLGTGAILLLRNRRMIATARAEARIRDRLATLNGQLVQANKLAALGQIAAGVGHEINQPLTAIGTYASNGRAFLAAGQMAAAIDNLGRIEALTARIGIITGELRGFARRASGEIGPVRIDDAVQGALLLLRERLRALAATVDYKPDDARTLVMAETVRLEQVLVNLLQNALDAGARRVAITTLVDADTVRVAIADDGPGLSAEAMRGLFQPFTTSKVDGLGLGLVISGDIMADLGGRLTAATSSAGACFTMHLRRAV